MDSIFSLCGKGWCVGHRQKCSSFDGQSDGHIWGLNVKQLRMKFISMGYDGNNVFDSARVGVTTQLKDNVVLFMMGMHYFAYWTNLVLLAY